MEEMKYVCMMGRRSSLEEDKCDECEIVGEGRKDEGKKVL
jgi:hypothetical protein